MTGSPERPSVLVASRSAGLTERLIRSLPEGRYATVAARTDEEVLDRLARGRAEALLYHVRNAGRGALALFDRLRERECDACVLAIGRDYGAEHAAALLRGGAYDYLPLPVRPGRLEESLRQGLDIRRAFLQVRDLSGQLKAANEALARERDGLLRWNRRFESLTKLGQAIAGALDPDAIVREVAGRLPELLDVDVVGVLWWEPMRTWVEGRAPMDRRLEAATRTALETSGRPTGPAAAGPGASVETPLLVGCRAAGLLRVARLAGPAYNPEEIELVQAVATSLALALDNAQTHSQVRNLALTDSLTGVPNRRALAQCLAREFKECERRGTPLCLLMVDLDHFKDYNDRFGHVCGDEILRGVAETIQRTVRGADVVARYGGEEFAVVLPRTDLAHASQLAERIRDTVSRAAFTFKGVPVTLTASLGVASIPDPALGSVEALIAAADAALYRAKTGGRNRVEVAGRETTAPLVLRGVGFGYVGAAAGG
jgi:diguanylate cyclase (GGDEF)-like protein